MYTSIKICKVMNLYDDKTNGYVKLSLKTVYTYKNQCTNKRIVAHKVGT